MLFAVSTDDADVEVHLLPVSGHATYGHSFELICLPFLPYRQLRRGYGHKTGAIVVNVSLGPLFS